MVITCSNIFEGKSELSHLLGTRVRGGDSHFDAWYEQDLMIITWWWNLMTTHIRNCQRYDIHIKPKSYKLELLGELVA